MALLQPITDLAEICFRHGISNVVISPGSRSAALVLAFTRHGGFNIQVVMDERAAAFVALGMAQQLRKPVVLICTSGSAGYNYAPAVSEAYFQQIPLLVLTADRPKEWIHQHEGQTIYQSGLYGNHVLGAFELPVDYAHPDTMWFINRTINQAILSTSGTPSGPVHVNIPIREPFYPDNKEDISLSENIRIIRNTEPSATLTAETWHELISEWEGFQKILIVGGQYVNSALLNTALGNITTEWDIPVVGDIISNQGANKLFISHHDVFLKGANKEELKPDLLITYGLSLVSKDLKQFLRNKPALQHWHISEDPRVVDTFQSLTRQVPVSAEYFFENLFEKVDYQQFVQGGDPEYDSAYNGIWQQYEMRGRDILSNYLRNLTTLNDLSCVNSIVSNVWDGTQLHVANSMPIRYVNLMRNTLKQVTVFSNRGTSGIDGCTSTALGAAMVSNDPVVLITGDVAFLYDRNGLLNYSLPHNLKIVVINNGGGNIFRMIDGPSSLPELETYFESRHNFSAERTAADSGIEYFSVTKLEDLDSSIGKFLASDNTSLLEVFTDPVANKIAWTGLKSYAMSAL